MIGGPDAAAGGHRVVIAELEVQPQQLDAFVALAGAFAAECLAREPGCRQFQVVRLESAPPRVLFFEVYGDDAAFEAHCAAGHLSAFKLAFADLVTGEQPLRHGRLEPNGSGTRAAAG